ncbi:MAG TPA: response regulator transcription factor [Chthoniobacteraceae bacterium]|jgi:DNA-binding response OmpR family regulator|nr:response regulator transcription factor [Chthoniobacteraceae bacterium]
MKVLVVEDDPEIAAFVTHGLQRSGFEVDCAGNGEAGLKLALSAAYDLAVVDLMLPGRDGLSLIEEVRAAEVSTPVIVLSAKRSTVDKVACLRRGADDYLSKPFDLAELLARVEALLRRSRPAGENEHLEAAGVVLDLVNRTVRRDGVRIELSPREFALLELLMRNQGRALSKYYLMERLWEYAFNPQTNLVDVLVCRLRNSLDRDHAVKLIQTLRGIGYVFRAS